MNEALITLAHGGGSEQMQQLIRDYMLSAYGNPVLAQMADQATLAVSLEPGQSLAFSTDSFVVSPLEFPGGDIGSLAINGTVNDLAMGGAVPRWLSCALIIEEGFPLGLLQQICRSLAKAAKSAGVQIVTGDTKVVPKGQADQLYINTSGIGVIDAGIALAPNRIRPGDRLLVSGPLGSHGAAILAAREQFSLETDIRSDCQPLNGLVQHMLRLPGVRCMRDPTRGGLANVLHEFAADTGLGFELDESELPIEPAVRSLCELLGLEPLHLACEGCLLAVVAPEHAEALLSSMRSHPAGQGSAMIGESCEAQGASLWLKNAYGVRLTLPPAEGELLPRIC